MPKLAFPGGALIGCSAGFVNVPRIKGSHTAMKSGMLAAEAIAAAIARGARADELTEYDAAVRGSWIADELKLVQNAEPLVAKFGGDARHHARRAPTCGCARCGFGSAEPLKHHRDAR